MNRTIKFRAWHKTLKKMLYPPGKFDSMTLCRDSEGKWASFQSGHTAEPNEPQFLSAHMTWDGRWYQQGELQDVEWMQFTGLYDKNENPIYEGDVLHSDYNRFIIEYDERFGAFHGIIYSKNHPNIPLALNEISGGKIIGNIFENPELLNGSI